MRPGNRLAPIRAPPPPAGAAGSVSAAAAAAPVAMAAGSSTSQKRTREQDSTGLTPEAKKAKKFSEAAKAHLTLYVREKDGAPLSLDRYMALKASFAYYVEDMMTKNLDPPICAGRWQESRSVVKIPMATEQDLLFMRCFLDKAYLVQSEEEFNKSKGKVYVAFLKDRLEPELTGMRPDKLHTFVSYYKRQTGIEGLFEIKMAAKTPKGKAIHLIMDEKAEEIFVKEGCKIPFAGAGWIMFEDRAVYIARIKEQEREKAKPRQSALDQGVAAQAVEKISLGGEEEVIELDKEETSSATATSASTGSVPLLEARELGKILLRQVQEGDLDKEAAEAKLLEEMGMSLDDVTPRRTVLGSSWSEEVEHMRELEKSRIPAQIDEAMVESDKGQDDDDHAHFELEQEQSAQDGGHRAAGSGPAST